jgi:predicted PhzF superfamily epimerase YddE/YHI9
VVGPQSPGHETDFEVRALIGDGGYEDPVTGSVNASLAQWLIGAGLAPLSYIVAQGTAMQRAGRVHLRKSDGEIWVGGDVVDCIKGEVHI